MSAALKARVRQGRLVLDEPTDLPEGSEVSLGLEEELVRMPEEKVTAAIVVRALLAASNDELEQYARIMIKRWARGGVDPVEELDAEQRRELDRDLREGLVEMRAGVEPLSNEEVFRRLERAEGEALTSR